jgi:hypothetical protein
MGSLLTVCGFRDIRILVMSSTAARSKARPYKWERCQLYGIVFGERVKEWGLDRGWIGVE